MLSQSTKSFKASFVIGANALFLSIRTIFQKVSRLNLLKIKDKPGQDMNLQSKIRSFEIDLVLYFVCIYNNQNR